MCAFVCVCVCIPLRFVLQPWSSALHLSQQLFPCSSALFLVSLCSCSHTHPPIYTHTQSKRRAHTPKHSQCQTSDDYPSGTHTHTNPLTPFPSQSASLANIWNIKRRWWHPTAHNDQSVTMETTHRRRPRHRHEGVILGERKEHSVPVNKQISSFQHDFVRNAFRASASRSRRRILQNCVHYALSPSSTLSLRWR